VVLVATVRALKRHGGVPSANLATPDAAAVERGLGNLEKHLESIAAFGKPAVVAINRFGTDAEEEIAVIRTCCERLGVSLALAEHYAKGAEGAVELAHAVMAAAPAEPSPLQPLYERSEPIKTKIEKIAKAMYGARSVIYAAQANKDIQRIEKLGYADLPVCMAKTQSSLSDDPAKTGRPRDFDVTVKSLVLATGAGYIVPLLGDIIRMPGLPLNPAAHRVDLVDGKVVGLMAG